MASNAPIALSPYLLVVRIILFLVFVPAGIQSIAMTTFTGAEADRVRELRERSTSEPQLVEPEATPTSLQATNQQTVDDSYPARKLYATAVRMEDMGWNNPELLAWIGALCQLIGGALLLPGLLTRVWGFALCVVMGAMFIVTSWPLVNDSVTTFLYLEPAAANQVGIHLALFGLSLAMLVCGGGGMSLDRLIFGKSAKQVVHFESDKDEESEA